MRRIVLAGCAASAPAWLLASAGALAWSGARAHAQDRPGQVITTGDAGEPSKPAPKGPIRGRMLQVFDFEERETNPGDVPRFWYRAQDSAERPRPGFPSWNLARLAYLDTGDDQAPSERAYRGVSSVMLPTRGGSTSLLLDAGAIPVFPDTDYAVSCVVRTNRMVAARAALIARVLGTDGKPIPGSDRVSQLVTAEDAWRELTVRLVTNQPGAAFIQLELVVLQPTQVSSLFPGPTRPSDAFRLNLEDLDAQAWFDDLTVLQLPRVSLVSSAAGNVSTAPVPPEFAIVVRDLANEQLTLELDAVDASGARIPGMRQQLGAGTANTRWTPNLPKAGWYRVRMKLATNAGVPVGGTFTDIVWLPAPDSQSTDEVILEERIDVQGVSTRDASQLRAGRGRAGQAPSGVPSSAGDVRRFALVLDEVPTRHLMTMPSLLEQTGINVVTLPLWTRSLTETDVPGHTRTMQTLVRQLVGDYVDVTLSMPRLPDMLGERSNIAVADVASVFSRPREEWLPFAQEPFEKLGALSGRWQVGVPAPQAGFFRGSALADLANVRRGVGAFVPGLSLAVPSSIAQDWEPAALVAQAGPTRLLMHIPPSTTPESVRYLASQRVNQLGGRTDVSLQWLLPVASNDVDASPMQRAARVVQHMVELWRLMGESFTPGAGPSMSIALGNPWRFPEGDRDYPRATPELAAFLHTRKVLTDARIVGDFPVREGLRCAILAPKSSSTSITPTGWLVAWNEGCDADKSFIDMPVAGPVQLIDLFGNATPLNPTLQPDGFSRTVRIPVTQQPVFVAGIDVALAQFLAGVTLTPPMLDAAAELGEHTITLTNPWPQSMSGKLSILEPGGFDEGERDRSWRINPRTISFALPAGARREFPISVAFRASEEAGPKRFLMGIDLTGDLPYGVLRVERELELGLDRFRVDSSFSRRGEDIIAECIVTNTSDKPMTLEVTALAPGVPRARATIPDLAPGSQAIRRFTYPQGAAGLLNQRVVFSVLDPDLGERLTKSVTIQ